MRYRFFIPTLLIVLAAEVLIMTQRGEGKVEISGENQNEIVVTIDNQDRSVTAEADSLRKAYKLPEAIEIYNNVLEMKDNEPEVKKEAEYNLGLCYYWIDRKKAEVIFNNLLQQFPDDGEFTAYCQHCLALLKIQKFQFQSAIYRLQSILDEKTCSDDEFYARTRFQIGRIYLAFLNDRDNANLSFRKVLTDYPDSKIAEHTYVINSAE